MHLEDFRRPPQIKFHAPRSSVTKITWLPFLKPVSSVGVNNSVIVVFILCNRK